MTNPDTVEEKGTDWSDPDLHRLLNQALAIEFVKAAKEPKTKTHWLDVLNSGTITALITIILGTLLGTVLSSSIQEKSKRNDAELASYKEYLERERQVVQRIFQAIGSLEAAAENLIATTDGDFDTTNSSSKEKERVKGLKGQILRDYNTADTQWHTQEMQLGLDIDLEHQNDAAVISAWQSVSLEMTHFSDCAKRWVYTARPPTSVAMQKEACNESRNKLNDGLHTLTRSIIAARARAASSIGKLSG